MASLPYPESWVHQWQWRGEPVSYVVAGPEAGAASADAGDAASTGDTVVLIHGFGACKEHWRHTIAPLAAGRRVLALDLLGFGASGKPRAVLAGEEAAPGDCRYGIDLWAEQVCALLEALVPGPVSLVGNSIGGVVALRAAQRLEQLGRPARQVVLVDCAQRALDDKRLAEQPPLRRYGRPLLKSLVRQRWLTTLLFNQLSRPGVIRKVLGVAYPSGANVDDALVAALLEPTRQAGAAEAFRGFINLFDDLLAPELLAELHTPVAMIWGEADPWEPVAEALRWQDFACVRSLEVLPGLGHCPHDEAPERVNPLLLQALAGGAA